MTVITEPRWGGAKGFFGSGGLVLLKVSGTGLVIVCCYGALEERTLTAGQNYTVDTGHIVGFDSTVQFAVQSPADGSRQSWAAKGWSVG